jgi:hypothetical protein
MRTYQTLFVDRRLVSAECGAGKAQGGAAEWGTRICQNKNKNSERKGFCLSGETPLLCLEAALRFFFLFFLFWTICIQRAEGVLFERDASSLP